MKKTAATFLLFLCMCFSTCLGQNVTNVQFRQENNRVIVTYYLDQKANVKVSYSTNRGRTFTAIKKATGDVGQYVSPGYKVIVWDVLSEVDEIRSNDVIFKVSAESKEYNLFQKYGRYCYELPHHAMGFFVGNRSGLSYKRYFDSGMAIELDLTSQIVVTEGINGGYNWPEGIGDDDMARYVFSLEFDFIPQKKVFGTQKNFLFLGCGVCIGYGSVPDKYQFYPGQHYDYSKVGKINLFAQSSCKLGLNAVLSYEKKFCSPWLLHLDVMAGMGFLHGSEAEMYMLYFDYGLSIGLRYCSN